MVPALVSIIQFSQSLCYEAIDQGWIPDFILRLAIRFLSRRRLQELERGTIEEKHERKTKFIEDLRLRPVAIEQKKANVQHYEVPTEFIKSCLGAQMKYSSCYFPHMRETLDNAEVLMMEDYCQKAQLEDGLSILDLGCGWGSLCLYLAQKYPNCRVKALSNSRTQKSYIDDLAEQRQITNLKVHTGDMMTFEFPSETKFDRVVSIEMLEHMKNYEYVFKKVANWIKPDGLFFAQTFCHTSHPYHFEQGDGWMAQNFFSGGTMPSLDLFAYFQKDLNLESSWFINGKHYARTSELWLNNLDTNRHLWIKPNVLSPDLGFFELKKGEERHKTFYRFRTFFMAVAEFFALNDGESWGVGHFLFSKK